jgi:hypothetical protein
MQPGSVARTGPRSPMATMQPPSGPKFSFAARLAGALAAAVPAMGPKGCRADAAMPMRACAAPNRGAKPPADIARSGEAPAAEPRSAPKAEAETASIASTGLLAAAVPATVPKTPLD